MDNKENLNFDSFKQLILEDYTKAFFFNKVIENKRFKSFYPLSLMLVVLSKYVKHNDVVYNMPLPCFFSDNDIDINKVAADCLVIAAERLAMTNNYDHNISVLRGIVYALRKNSNMEPLVIASISLRNLSEIDILKMLEKLGEEKLPANLVLTDIEKAKGDFIQAKTYFESKNIDKIKVEQIDYTNYEFLNNRLKQGILIARTTQIPVIYYPAIPIDSSEYLLNTKSAVGNFKDWILNHNLADENTITEMETIVQNMDIFIN